MDTNERHRALGPMLGDGISQFDGKRVCAEILSISFHIFRTLQSSVEITPGSMATCNGFEDKSNSSEGTKSDDIICFQERTADGSLDVTPDRCERHTAFFSKKEVPLFFNNEFRMLYFLSPPLKSYSSKSCGEKCSTIKHRKTTQ